MNNWFANMGARFVKKPEKRRQERQVAAALTAEIERIVSESKASFRMVHNYTKKLIDPATNALNYIDQNLSHIPEPIVLDPAQWGLDKFLNTLFVNRDSIRDLLHTSKTLRAFFTHENTPQAVALVTADWRQKTVMGIAKEGDMVRRDVPQLAYYFENHSIVDVYATLDTARKGLRSRILGALIGKVVTDIQGLREWRKELEKERKILELFIQHASGVQSTAGTLKNEVRVTEAKKLLVDMDAKEKNLRTQIGDPESQLEQVVQVLLNPQSYFSIQPVSLRLNRLGIQVKKQSDEPTYDITLAKFKLVDQTQKVIMWILANR